MTLGGQQLGPSLANGVGVPWDQGWPRTEAAGGYGSFLDGVKAGPACPTVPELVPGGSLMGQLGGWTYSGPGATEGTGRAQPGAAAPTEAVPSWLQGLLAHQESVRMVELPVLQELRQSEVGPLVAGD